MGKTLKFNKKFKKLFLLLIALVLISLVATGIILSKLMKEASVKEESPWFFKQSLQMGEPLTLENTFILSAKENKLTFLHKNQTYTIEGELSEEISGVADIVIDGEEISKIRFKPNGTEGVLTSYTENTLTLNNTTLLNRNDDVPVYKTLENNVQQTDWGAFVIGASKIKCILEDSQVTAILLEEDVTPKDVRVIIKNKDSLFYSDIYIKKQSTQEFISAKAQMQNTTMLEISDAQGLILCDANGTAISQPYLGIFRVLQTQEGLVLINEVEMETYLKYVLPSEMPTSFETEALKAQAVCARTYAYAQMHNTSYAQYGANMDDSTSFQVYHKQVPSEKTTSAVESTKGEVVSCNGSLITCYYYSTSPGVTNDLSVWGASERDYIAVMGLDTANQLNLANHNEFSNYIRNTYACYDTSSPYYRWQAKLNVSQVKNTQKGLLQSIEIKTRNDAGYITELVLHYENGQETLLKEGEIRNKLGTYLSEIVLNDESVRTNFSALPSACFEVLHSENGTITLQGGGFGHGIGLSQHGANGMAKEGHNYKEIVEYYYDNVVIKNVES